MYSVNLVERSVTDLFHEGIPKAHYTEDAVKSLLDTVDFHALTQAVRHNARFVSAFATEGSMPGFIRYRGRDLFGQHGTLLYEDRDDVVACPCLSRVYELWLLEGGRMLTVSRLTLSFTCPFAGTCRCDYREIVREPWQSEMCLDLEELTKNLRQMCLPVYRNEIPMYEL